MGVARVALVAGLGLIGMTGRPAVAGADSRTAKVDWGGGFVVAEGIGIANRAAPSPAAARGPARRMAEDAARQRLAAALPTLPLAVGGTLATKLGDNAVKLRLDRAVAHAMTVTAEPETDGSWKVTLAVPLEAVRQALEGPRTLGTDDAKPPAVIIVDGAAVTPAIGYSFGPLAAPTLFVKDVPAWAKDAPRVKAKRVKQGVIDVDVPKATDATLFVIVLPR